DLELFFQLLNECRYFLLSLRFYLLSQRLLDFLTFLNVAGLKFCPLLRIQLKSGVANCCVSFTRNNLPPHILPLSHEVSLLGRHPHPKLRVTLEILPGIRRHCEPAILYALPSRHPMGLAWWQRVRLTRRRSVRHSHWRRPVRCGHWRWPTAGGTMLLWLRLCGSATQSESRQADE